MVIDGDTRSLDYSSDDTFERPTPQANKHQPCKQKAKT